MHARIENGQIVEYPIVNLRQCFPNSSLPADLTNDAALPEGYVYVGVVPFPEHDPAISKPVPAAPVQNPDGRWVISYDIVPLTEEELVQRQQELVVTRKDARQQEVDSIVVTTQSGRMFDGNEDAQNRMSRAVTAMEDTDVIPWVLADNTVTEVTRAELKEALKLAGAAMAEIWVRPYL